jgi:FKBP-type peptidyl-prolyl cis-trans isomerase FkpA
MRSGVKLRDLRVGGGAVAERGATVSVRYDASLNRGERFQEGISYSFRLGRREVIAGLEYGVEGMRVGGLRRITVSPHLGYRDEGVPGVIPPNAVLIFDVELLDVIAPHRDDRGPAGGRSPPLPPRLRPEEGAPRRSVARP